MSLVAVLRPEDFKDKMDAPHADFWIRDLAQLLPRGGG